MVKQNLDLTKKYNINTFVRCGWGWPLEFVWKFEGKEMEGFTRVEKIEIELKKNSHLLKEYFSKKKLTN
jgi:hypothetical protein